MAFFANYFGLFVQWFPFILVLIVGKYYFDKRRLFILGSRLPGPKPWPIIGNALDYLVKDLDALRIITELNKKYAFLAHWLGHRLYIAISTPEDAEIYFKTRHLIDKDDLYKFLEPVLGKGIAIANGVHWKKARKSMESSFRYSALLSFTDMFIEKANVLLQRLKEEEGKKSSLVYPYIKHCTFDIVFEATTGFSLNAQQEEIEVLDQADILQTYISERICKLWERFDFLYKLSEKGKDYFRRLDQLNNLKELIFNDMKTLYYNQKKTSKGSSKETLNKFGLLENLMESEEWDDDSIKDQMMTIIIAGYETTATAIYYALIMLGIHQDIQEKLYNELLPKSLNEKDLHRSEYLEMVIKETLRLYPILPFIGRKVDQDIQMGKHLIPKGATLGLNIFKLHRDPLEYDNPEGFNPDHFLPENIKKRHPYSFLPFAAGMRNCLGGKFAMIKMTTILSKIILNYKIECDLKMEDIKVQFKITLKIKDGEYPIRLIRR